MKRINQYSIVLACCISLLSACQSVQTLEGSPPTWAGNLQPGDEIEILLYSGQHIPMKVTNVDSAGVEGTSHRYAFTDIKTLSKKQLDVTRTTLLILGVVAVGAAASSGGGGGGGGGGGY